MRISKDKIETLKNSILSILPQSEIFLFGSRVDDKKRGGDIDVLILAERKLTFYEKAHIEKDFFHSFGEQKLDLISFEKESNNPFKKIALLEAIQL